ncbi:MAG: hypothetical protein RBR59_06405, partial [Sulfurimonadaceae bacterium]|nr:hypothetical protein [Sulfurimonadaceae bacterium]
TQDGQTHYVISGTGQQASDIQNVFKNIEITPPKDMNTGGDIHGKMTISGTISSTNGAASHQGATVPQDLTILPVTDAMTIAVEVANTAEDVATNLKITLSNPNDGSKTELLDNSITIKITETWNDDAQDTGTGKGTLTDTSGKYNVTYNSGTDTYTITPKNAADNFKVGTAITGLQYTPASNRDGDVKFEVSVKNKETGSILELDSTGKAEIKVTPVIDAVLNATTVIATGTEDQIIAGVDLANPVKLVITADAFPDKSEKIGNIILDEVPNGFTVWYNDGTNLVMATNIGQTSGTVLNYGAFDLTPNIAGDDTVTRNKWLVPTTDGVMPEIYINAPENWAGDFNFKAQISIKEENLSTAQKFVVPVTGTITPVADGVTIDPTKTFGDAFSWIDLKLNANMKDVDGSEVMNLELGGLGKNAQFRLEGNLIDVDATYNTTTSKWELKGITYDQINNVQFTNDKSGTVTVTATTSEVDKDGNVIKVNEVDLTSAATVQTTFELKLADTIGDFKLDAGVSLDFDNLGAITTLKGINTIDLSAAGANNLLNLTLEDVLAMSDNLGEITIKGKAEDTVTLKVGNGWEVGAKSGGFTEYTNTDNSNVIVKIEDLIQPTII